MASVVQKYMMAVKRFGWKDTLIKMYSFGDVKFGDLVGTDRNGNKYYQNLDYPFGQSRWVEYADIHNYEPTSIPPEWHGWIHYQWDELPEHPKGGPGHVAEGQHNWTAHRSRGYGVGSLNQKHGEPDMYWKQPGHPLHAEVRKAKEKSAEVPTEIPK